MEGFTFEPIPECHEICADEELSDCVLVHRLEQKLVDQNLAQEYLLLLIRIFTSSHKNIYFFSKEYLHLTNEM